MNATGRDRTRLSRVPSERSVCCLILARLREPLETGIMKNIPLSGPGDCSLAAVPRPESIGWLGDGFPGFVTPG